MSQIVSLAETAVREGDTVRSSLTPAGAPESVGGLLARNASRFAERAVCLEKRDGGFRAVTWRDLLVEVASFAEFLAAAGVGSGHRVAVVSRNRREALATEFAVMGLGAAHVPIFAGYAAGQLGALIASCAARVVIVSSVSQLKGVELGPGVRTIVVYDAVDRADRQAGADGRAVVGFADAVRRHAGRGAAIRPCGDSSRPPAP